MQCSAIRKKLAAFITDRFLPSFRSLTAISNELKSCTVLARISQLEPHPSRPDRISQLERQLSRPVRISQLVPQLSRPARISQLETWLLRPDKSASWSLSYADQLESANGSLRKQGIWRGGEEGEAGLQCGSLKQALQG